MKERFVDNALTVTVRDTEIPAPQPGQLLIRVVVSGTNPKDWKLPHWYPDVVLNQGDDPAGYIEAVGEGVLGFRKGDRVAGFHQILTPHGSYAEYAIAWAHTTFHVPENISLEEAATIPLAAFTAAASFTSLRFQVHLKSQPRLYSLTPIYKPIWSLNTLAHKKPL
ncbi:uncharacterized protein N7482_009126 [Penicillium canariense]|uniref:Alcohol dehydrogenase-like N-terminal domain-containing protein n=1 Tax=Penicillium canariense TaxID=189055 RepID=A0A9W9LFJ1_9EURO|nr:uncharacterized protein N7482_009126 [Penicillium canariense]KAJ5152648.1 hypothetical protein N7482_009126 [Penicillium canariense]